VTSGAYGFRAESSIALGYVPVELASAESGFEIEIIGDRRKATRRSTAPIDAPGARMRS
jgi:dimethylglycine dehydrogenase